MPNRGEIWYVDLEPVKGHEQGGNRPVLIVSVDAYNAGPSTIIFIVPITRKDKNIPCHVEILPNESGLPSKSFILCDHGRSISKDRLDYKKGRCGQISDTRMREVEYWLKNILGL